MRNLIVYGTTYGFTEKCALELSKKLISRTDCYDANKIESLDLSLYNAVIIGSSIYVGQINKNVKNFVERNAGILKNKALAFFLCCGFVDNLQKNLELNYPKELLEKAVSKECFGGLMDLSKMKFMHKIITKMVKKATAKEGSRDPKPMPENIDKMADIINNSFSTN